MLKRFALLLIITGLLNNGAFAQQGAPVQGYETKLQRLAEVLGSLHYLRNLCGEESSQWRDFMQSLLTAENPDEENKALMIARFNAGYRSFSEIYVRCTQTAEEAIMDYVTEGQSLATSISRQFGDQ